MKKLVCDICQKDASDFYDIKLPSGVVVKIMAQKGCKRTTDICFECIAHAVLDGSPIEVKPKIKRK